MKPIESTSLELATYIPPLLVAVRGEALVCLLLVQVSV
jgi:hypothetical protein